MRSSRGVGGSGIAKRLCGPSGRGQGPGPEVGTPPNATTEHGPRRVAGGIAARKAAGMKEHLDTMLCQSLDENGKEKVGKVLETGTGGADSASMSPRKGEPKEDRTRRDTDNYI